MAPLYTVAAAVCLVALSELRQVAADQTTYKLKAQDVTEDAYFAVNLARNGRLPVHIKVVAEDKELVSELTEKVNTEGAGLPARDVTEESCKPLINSENFKEMFHHAFDYSAEADAKPNYRQTLQEALKAGLALFNEDYFTGLIARTTELADMTEEDLKAPTNDGTAATAVPTVIFAGLVAMLTGMSV
ncbi:hypothetical protein EBH_0042230 [Eimeria brunetti]|uniref:SAG family member n=1 Tax=Eimeria brunetti TaxID=51314 RepID=U6LD05_9EIME|nr:hypothetical protein EBH_0042230 [Eimeria brunetti]